MKAYKVTISGDYLSEDKKHIDFQGVVGIVPALEDDLLLQAVRTRYAAMWLLNSKEYPARIKKLRGCYVDSQEAIEHNFSFVGKDIKEMTYEELQDFAAANQIRRIPLYKNMPLRQCRAIAYVEYANKVNGMRLSEKSEGFDFAKLPKLVATEEIHNDRVFVKNNEQVLEEEAKQTSALTIEDLKQILTERGVQFDKRLGFDKLYALAFPN